MNMRLIGAKTIKDVVPEMVDASNIHTHVIAVPGDRLYDSNCASFRPPFLCDYPKLGTDLLLFCLMCVVCVAFLGLVADEGMQSARLRDVRAKM